MGWDWGLGIGVLGWDMLGWIVQRVHEVGEGIWQAKLALLGWSLLGRFRVVWLRVPSRKVLPYYSFQSGDGDSSGKAQENSQIAGNPCLSIGATNSFEQPG